MHVTVTLLTSVTTWITPSCMPAGVTRNLWRLGFIFLAYMWWDMLFPTESHCVGLELALFACNPPVTALHLG